MRRHTRRRVGWFARRRKPVVPLRSRKLTTQVDLDTREIHLLARRAEQLPDGRYLALCGKEFLLAGRWRRWTVSRRKPCGHCFCHLIGDVVPLEDGMSPLRVVRCDDCTYVGRYVQDDVASQRAYLHAKHKHHRTRVANEGEEDTTYDCRPPGPTESGAERVE